MINVSLQKIHLHKQGEVEESRLTPFHKHFVVFALKKP